LLRSIPRIHRKRLDVLAEIQGGVPDLTRLPPGCAFAARCPRADEHCRQERPAPIAVAPDHVVSCWKANDG
jgi:oligopeptide/dipeptide ABC transporter ATP-binding protein